MHLPEEQQIPFLKPLTIVNSQVVISVKTVIIGLLLFLALFFTLSLHNRILHIDEATLSEQVYWLTEEGTVKTVLYEGIGTGLGDELLVYHKLFIWLATGIAWLFGHSLELLRCLSLLSALLLCATIYQYSQRFITASQSRLPLFFLLTILLLFSNALFFTFSFIFRPELMLTCLGFGSFYMLTAYLKHDKLKYLYLAAIFAGLASLTHLNGLVYVGAAGLLLLFDRKIKPLFIFSITSLLVSAIYFIDVLGPGDFDRFILQFSGAPAFKESDLHPLNRILRVFEEHRRYFHSAREVSFSVLMILIIAARFRYLWKHHSILMRYTLFGGITLAIINQGQTSKYALLLLPFACLLMALAMMDILKEGKKKQIRWFMAAFVVYFCIQVYDMYEVINRKMDLPARNAAISQHIPWGSRVYGPGSFFFNQVEHYEILSLESYYAKVGRFHTLKYNKKDLLSHARSLDCDYVVLDLLFLADAAEEGIRPQEFQTGHTYFGYLVTHVENDYYILKRLQDQQARIIQ